MTSSALPGSYLFVYTATASNRIASFTLGRE
jgi:hypothetical protein